MSRVLVRGDPVVAMGDTGTITDGAVIVEGSRIAEVGPAADLLRRGEFDSVVGGPDHIVLPGFVNAHYHSECWTAPGLIDIIFELGNLHVGSGLIDTTEEIIELLATYGLAHAAKGGQTTLVDAFYGRPWLPRHGAEAVLRAYERVGLRVGLGVTMRDRNRYTHEDDDVFLSRFPQEIADEIRASPLGYAWPIDGQFALFEELLSERDDARGGVRILLAPDWSPTCSDELYVRCREAADRYRAPMTTHMLETRAEFAWSNEHVGSSPVRRLADLGVLSDDVSFSHFVWATDDDIALLAESGVAAIHCPGSNLRSAAGISRLSDILKAGGRVAYGTDGVSVGDREDFLEELRLACYLQRQPDRFSDHRLDSETVLRGATEVGADVTGFGEITGRLEAGYEADLLCVSKQRILFPKSRYANCNVLDVLLDRADASDIDLVMVAGRIVVQDGELTRIDEAALVARIAELTDELYRPTAEAARRRELAAIMTPAIESLCAQWYSIPVDRPGAVFNTRAPLAGAGGPNFDGSNVATSKILDSRSHLA